MSYGAYSSYAETVKLDFVESICKKTYKDFIDALDDACLKFDLFCSEIVDESDEDFGNDEQSQKIFDTYEKLQTSFLLKTGLALEVAYHCAEDRGDELDGGSFCLDGVYQLTPEAEKIKKDICRLHWTDFG